MGYLFSTLQSGASRPLRSAVVAVGWLAAALGAAPAWATLGGDAASVDTDQVRMQVRAARTTGGAVGTYTVHESTLPAGTQVRQYLSNAGVVFAVSWSGPFKPDLKQLLGTYFDTMLDRQAGHVHAGSPRIVQRESDLVVESAGRMRNFIGRAYLPAMLPPGITLQDIQ